MHKVLLVEDDKMLRDAFEILLQAQNKYDVHVAADGNEALQYCKKQTFNLILLDLMMPVLDGVGFLKKANLKKKAPDTRIVIMSNLSSGEELVQALELGAHHHVVKSDLAPKDVIRLVDNELANS